MLLFLYGEDSYRCFQKLQELKQKYIDASLGDTNLTTIDVKKLDATALAGQLFALPFIAKTRLVILPDLLSQGAKPLQEKFLELVEKIPETTVAVVYESGVPDQRTKLSKALLKHATVQEFKPLQGAALDRWITDRCRERGVQIAQGALRALLVATAGNSWRLANELDKLIAYVASDDQPIIAEEAVAELVPSTEPINVFALTDALVAGNAAGSVRVLRQLLNQGENEQYLLAMLGSSLRSLSLIRDALDRGVKAPPAIASETKLNPFVVKKQLAAAQQTTLTALAERYQALATLDVDIKRGMIDPSVGLELFLLRTASSTTV